MFGGKTEDLLTVLLIALLLFGAKKLPELSKAVGQSVKEVRKGFADHDNSEQRKETTNS